MSADEELMADLRSAITPLAPTVLPEGYALDSAGAAPAEDEEEPCDRLAVEFAPPAGDEAAHEEWLNSEDYLAVVLLPLSCALDAEDTPFERGAFGEVPSRINEWGLVEVLVGETVVQFDTTFTAELPAMVASLAPFDLDAALAATAAMDSAS